MKALKPVFIQYTVELLHELADGLGCITSQEVNGEKVSVSLEFRRVAFKFQAEVTPYHFRVECFTAGKVIADESVWPTSMYTNDTTDLADRLARMFKREMVEHTPKLPPEEAADKRREILEALGPLLASEDIGGLLLERDEQGYHLSDGRHRIVDIDIWLEDLTWTVHWWVGGNAHYRTFETVAYGDSGATARVLLGKFRSAYAQVKMGKADE